MFNMILNIGELDIGVKKNFGAFLKLMSLRPLSEYISYSRLTEAPASREQARVQACASSLILMSAKARQTRPNPFPRARGSAAMLEKTCDQYRQRMPARACEPGCRKKTAYFQLILASFLSGIR